MSAAPSLPGLADAGPSILPLRVRGLAFSSRGTELIRGIDMQLSAGGKTVLMGPNGAGKSLLLRLLHGLLRPTAGEVEWSGGLSGRELVRRQAMVFQRPVLLRRSVSANIRHALAARGVPREHRQARLDQALRSAHLERLAHRPARVLSGGEQQRLALARALSLGPEVLFLDEPTASLDPASTQAIEELMLQAHAVGTKVVLVTHDVGQAHRLADEVLFLHRGRLEEQTPAARFFETPSSEKSRAFLAGRIVL